MGVDKACYMNVIGEKYIPIQMVVLQITPSSLAAR